MPDPAARLFSGVCAEARAALLVSIGRKEAPSTHLALVADPRRAAELASEARTYADWNAAALEILHFPENPPPDIDAGRRMDRICERLSVLSALLEERPRLIIATPEALLGPCPEKELFESHQIRLRVGETVPYVELQEQLTGRLNYDSEALCEHPGQIAVRGGLIDIYPFDATRPYRIDFFGDEIESIRSFDPTSQRSGEKATSITIPLAADSSEAETREGAFGSYLPESQIHWIFEEPASLVRDHPYRFEKVKAGHSLRSIYQLLEIRKPNTDELSCICELDTDHELFRGAERIPLSTEATENYRFHSEAAGVGQDRFESEQNLRLKFELQLKDWHREGLELYFVTAGDSETKRIKELLADNPVTAQLKPSFLAGTISGGFIYKSPEDARSRLRPDDEGKRESHGKDAGETLTSHATGPEVKATESPAPPGNSHIHLPALDSSTGRRGRARSSAKQGFVIVTDTEYFGRRQRKVSGKRERARPTISQVDQLLDFTELADGDPLVHLQHGVCLFRGLTQIEIKGGAKEVITVEFAEQMTIHVPLHESHLLTRYVGLTKARPKLGKIGGSSWEKTRSAAERATLDYAAELLHLHARREQSGGHAFPPDHAWQRDFEAAFPFKETPDQLRAIEATKADMEKDLPMDRLICGDVGFGKTEVAIRAALKAVLAGKQVAMLVPTTVLCQQHFNTFRERM
ncbi:MAG TPA: CarD family transcriptional regulator, partial [Opitutales bacterium]|nr:CarD family transcriptional regulator [Opitutales bacterium]